LAQLKRKGDFAELKVAADLMDRGCRLSFPFGEDCDYDVIADRNGALHRIQIKYTESDGQTITLSMSRSWPGWPL
jgi:PD-(D/E)XK nuclease superfamily protein